MLSPRFGGCCASHPRHLVVPATLDLHIDVRVKVETGGVVRIGELAERTGVSQRLLRYYEEQGLLWPVRRPSGYRDYDAADVERVRRIRTLLAAGLHTATIAHVLPSTV